MPKDNCLPKGLLKSLRENLHRDFLEGWFCLEASLQTCESLASCSLKGLPEDLLKNLFQDLLNDLLEDLFQYLFQHLHKGLLEDLLKDLLKDLLESLLNGKLAFK